MKSPIDRMIEHEFDTVNDHLPKYKVSLIDLIDSESPSYITRSEETSTFRKEEIDFLKAEVPSEYYDEVLLPIVILRRISYGKGIYTVSGNKTIQFLIGKIVGYVDLEWSQISRWNPIYQLARPQVQVLRRKLPSTTCLGFTTATDESV